MAFHSEGDRTLQLPRILCLHGGGSNAKIFRAQCRALRAELAQHFRLVFANAPFLSEPGPDITSVYKDFGPYRRWFRLRSPIPAGLSSDDADDVENALNQTMEESDRQGATGAWVALLGFSQGATLAASLFLRQQIHPELCQNRLIATNFRFAILMAGRAPLISLTQDYKIFMESQDSRNSSLRPVSDYLDSSWTKSGTHLPIIHVHGLRDPGVDEHRHMYDKLWSQNARLVEWDGQHRVPIKTRDVLLVTDSILDVARSSGVFS